MHADSLQIDFVTRVDWKGKRLLLKAAFDTTIRAREAHHEIQFGHLARPTHDNEPADRAMFEVCNHKWTDLSQADRGIALLNDCKYGISVSEGTMALSLLKSSTHPDTRGDEGIHEFTYSLLPHAGGFDALKLLPAAYALNAPLTIMDGSIGDTEPLVSIDALSILVESVKMAQREHAVILRLYEAAGGAATGRITINFPVKEAFETNLLEERKQALDAGALTVQMRPFEVKTLLLTL